MAIIYLILSDDTVQGGGHAKPVTLMCEGNCVLR